jgi:hypothetical protein
MKKLIFMLFLAGCGVNEKHTMYMVRSVSNLRAECKVAKETKCGMSLEQCNNGMVYLCAHDVEMGVPL